ncbi:hypothetical protein ACFWGI_35630 [Streptomyces niveus]|uniref:hypothetical protein n=1 Tax=Streptomyces niveus TaxID=193462 RepID=UPI00365A2B5A
MTHSRAPDPDDWSLSFFQALSRIPGDDPDDFDPIDALRCTRCGHLSRAGQTATLADLNTLAQEHRTCLRTRP